MMVVNLCKKLREAVVFPEIRGVRGAKTISSEYADSRTEESTVAGCWRTGRSTDEIFNQKINETSVSIVHLATHGQFSSDPQKTFLLTASGSIKVDDLGSLFRTRGLNRTDEIELLVLSACETASGDNRAALGIAGTTVRAGARSAIASLWSLDDESSVEMMKQFYQHLSQGNISRAEALRLAQTSLMQNPQYSYPRYWAPFILLGNWL
jgi:CHAT domain-containing protein